jgi:hypothetical protein
LPFKHVGNTKNNERLVTLQGAALVQKPGVREREKDRMKVHLVSVSAAVITCSLLAQAQPVGTTSNANYGRTEGTFGYCERIDANSTALYIQLSKPFTPNEPAKQLEADRASKDYKAALIAEEDALAKISVGAALSACKNFLVVQQGKSRFPGGPVSKMPILNTNGGI